MTILAEADHRCRLRVLLSTSKKKPSKPGMILGELLFNFRALMGHADSNNKFKLEMYMQNKLQRAVFGSHTISIEKWLTGSLCFTIVPVPHFRASTSAQIITGQFPEPHPSNLSPGIFRLPALFGTKKSGPKTRFPRFPRSLESCLNLRLTFKEPDEFETPTPTRRPAPGSDVPARLGLKAAALAWPRAALALQNLRRSREPKLRQSESRGLNAR
ncbi:hypothetical protein DEU56DRAFT_207043 [Suillus clintonianus]|uniref:uncharacterized protein n=1 Tax=Suillus clintonianus TaxID=1904413 RepID=UPI001B869A18|nr:uncharacterized protein DEU56DRAFT_207043 [Suillus clintonianus]KAG2144512.1 hypothetical protein DEU56DRAFT_207043 [Suillus clintonianus]